SRQRADLVAIRGRLFVVLRVGGCVHLVAQAADHVVFAPLEEQHGVRHVLGVLPGRDQAGARLGAAVELVQQAGARAVLEHRVLAGAQAEHALQEVDALAHRVGVRKRAEIAVLPVLRAAVEAEARELVPGDGQVRIGLVVAEQDVVARREALDEVVLEQQRLALGTARRHLDAGKLRQHHLDARARGLLVEIRADPLLQVPRLADIERLAPRAEHPVHPGQIRQRGDERFGVEHDESIINRVKFAPFSQLAVNAMAKVEAVQIRPGNLLEWDKRIWRVLKSYHVHVGGRGGAFMQVEMKDIEAGTKTNQRFRTEDKVERAFVDPRDMEYLYQDGDRHQYFQAGQDGDGDHGTGATVHQQGREDQGRYQRRHLYGEGLKRVPVGKAFSQVSPAFLPHPLQPLRAGERQLAQRLEQRRL